MSHWDTGMHLKTNAKHLIEIKIPAEAARYRCISFILVFDLIFLTKPRGGIVQLQFFKFIFISPFILSLFLTQQFEMHLPPRPLPV